METRYPEVERTLFRVGMLTLFSMIVFVIIMTTAFLPDRLLPEMSQRMQLAGHAAGFAIFAILCFFSKLPNRAKTMQIADVAFDAIFVCMALATVTELGQSYLTNSREGEAIDFVADMAGSFLGILLATIVTLMISRHAVKRTAR